MDSKVSLTTPDCPNSACSTQVNPEKGQTQSWTFRLLGGISPGVAPGKQFILGASKRPYPPLKSAETETGCGHLK